MKNLRCPALDVSPRDISTRKMSRRHRKELSKPLQLACFNVEQQLYSELLPGDRELPLIAKGGTNPPTEETHYSHLCLGSYSIGHDPKQQLENRKRKGWTSDLAHQWRHQLARSHSKQFSQNITTMQTFLLTLKSQPPSPIKALIQSSLVYRRGYYSPFSIPRQRWPQQIRFQWLSQEFWQRFLCRMSLPDTTLYVFQGGDRTWAPLWLHS